MLFFSVAFFIQRAHTQTVPEDMTARTLRVRIVAPGETINDAQSLPNLVAAQLLEFPSVEPDLFSIETLPASLEEQLSIAERATRESETVNIVIWYDDRETPRLHIYIPDMPTSNLGEVEAFSGKLVVRQIEANDETVRREAVAIIAKSVVSGLVDAMNAAKATTVSTSDDAQKKAPSLEVKKRVNAVPDIPDIAFHDKQAPPRRLFLAAAFLLETPNIGGLPVLGLDVGVGGEFRYGFQLLLGYLAFAKQRHVTSRYRLTIDRHPIVVGVRKAWYRKRFSVAGDLAAVADYARSHVDVFSDDATSKPDRNSWQLSLRAMVHLSASLPYRIQIWLGLGAEIFLVRPRYVYEINGTKTEELDSSWTAQPVARIGAEYAFF